MQICANRSGISMGEPKIKDKRWSVDLEKRIQSSHFESESYQDRYLLDSTSGREVFIIDILHPILVELGTLEPLHNTV